MKNVLIKLIKLYQITPLHSHSYCRFVPTCSNYAIIAIERFGVLKGSMLAIKRIVRCRPHGSSGIDLVPEELSSKVL